MSPAYGKGPAKTLRYNPGGTTSIYYDEVGGAEYGTIGSGTSPAYALNAAYSPERFGGGATPGYSAGGMTGMKHEYRGAATGQSPAYDQGNAYVGAPAYSLIYVVPSKTHTTWQISFRHEKLKKY
jgi:hypothetical protein